MKNHSEKHQFAVYVPHLLDLVQKTNAECILNDPDLVHRIAVVLRLESEETLILFDQQIHCVATIAQITKKKSITFIIESKHKNKVEEPALTFMLPLLKREALETALYSLTELGVSAIQLVITAKSQQQWTAKEHERAHKIIIAAAEQSKNFAFPSLAMPVPLEKAISTSQAQQTIVLDPNGVSLFSFLGEPAHKKLSSLALISGPEGGLTADEIKALHALSLAFCSLTKTVLRASQAAAVSSGIIRSYYASL